MPVTLDLDDRRKTFRSFIRLTAAAWTSFFLTDLVAARATGAPLEYLCALRFAGTSICIVFYVVVRNPKVSARTLNVIEAIVFPIGGIAVSLSAIVSGGIASPLSQGVAIVTLVRALLPAPWTRALPSALVCALMFPITLSTAALFMPSLASQFRSSDLWTFLLTVIFLCLTAALASAGSNLQWVARTQVEEARRLGAYRLVARIGSGGMGEVWLARQMPLDRPVALKLLKKRVLEEPGALRRFKREALAASSLAHPNTIRVFDFGASDDGVFYIAMELLDGLDLEAIIARSGSLAPARALHLARQACASLAEAHHAGIVHCDIKPANIFVTHVGDDHDFVKVLDFGLAHVSKDTEGASTVIDSIRGTPAFMPPEIVRGERVGPESDVYAMGALLYYMLTGTTVFKAPGFHEMVLAQLETQPERPSARLGYEIPRDLEDIVMKCLAKGRGDRYVTARELEAALAACASMIHWTKEDARVAWSILRPSVGTLVTRPG